MSFSMNFSTEKLVKILKENRETHAKTAAEMKEDHKVALKSILEQKIKDLEAGKKVSHKINLAEPMDYINKYDQVIKMLELTEDTNIQLTEYQFQQYVMDEWPEKETFRNVSDTYKSFRG